MSTYRRKGGTYRRNGKTYRRKGGTVTRKTAPRTPRSRGQQRPRVEELAACIQRGKLLRTERYTTEKWEAERSILSRALDLFRTRKPVLPTWEETSEPEKRKARESALELERARNRMDNDKEHQRRLRYSRREVQ